MAAPGYKDSPAGLPVNNPSDSYWLTEPSPILLGHRTTKDLPQAVDVVIVGSGITGAFTAHCLKEKAPDLKVVMLEAREACSGATGRVSLRSSSVLPQCLGWSNAGSLPRLMQFGCLEVACECAQAAGVIAHKIPTPLSREFVNSRPR